MRLSKTRKQIIKDHQNNKPSKEQLAEIRKERKKMLKISYVITDMVVCQGKDKNPKKNKSDRRIRTNPWSDIKLNPVFKKNKYGYTPIITKAAK